MRPPDARSRPGGGGSDTKHAAGGFGTPSIRRAPDTTSGPGNVLPMPRPDAERLRTLTAILVGVDQHLPYSFWRRSDGSLGRMTTVGTALRNFRSGRWPVTDDDVKNARTIRNLERLIDDLDHVSETGHDDIDGAS